MDLIVTPDGVCTYVSPEGKRCAARQDRHQARHWFTCHVIQELKQIESNKLMMMNARIITSEARMRVATEYKTRCPFIFCELTRSTGFFVREDTLARHMVHCADKKGLKVSRDWALWWAWENMEVLRNSEEFGNGYLAAIWRIHRAH
jgi:hypothetical protein